MRLTYSTEVIPNRSRGYDAFVTILHRGEVIGGNTLNAPTVAQAQAMADAWIVQSKADQPKRTRAKRTLSDGELESLEAARNERDYV